MDKVADDVTVLIVDDMPNNITVLAACLSDSYRLRVATTGPEALEICRGESPPALVLLDVVMPEMDGFEVCRQLKEDPATADIPVIFVTGLANDEDEEHGFRVGGVDFVVKPVSRLTVRKRVGVHLELAAAKSRLQRVNYKLSRYLEPNLARSITSGQLEAQVASKRAKVTVFFSDIVGFTKRTEMLQPEEMTGLLNDYFAVMSEVIDRHGGTFDKYVGDAVMVYFGDPDSRGPAADAAACVAMAVEMQGVVGQLSERWLERGVSEPLAVRMGIATGYCTVGSFGGPRLLHYTVMGGPVNLAARLEAHAPPGGILLSEATFSLVRDKWPVVPSRRLSLKGLGEITAYEVQAEAVSGALGCNIPGALVRVQPSRVPVEQRLELATILREAARALDEQ